MCGGHHSVWYDSVSAVWIGIYKYFRPYQKSLKTYLRTEWKLVDGHCSACMRNFRK